MNHKHSYIFFINSAKFINDQQTMYMFISGPHAHAYVCLEQDAWCVLLSQYIQHDHVSRTGRTRDIHSACIDQLYTNKTFDDIYDLYEFQVES